MAFRYPPIASLRAFEVASRKLNYTRAAEELFITQSAISHQIKHIEALWEIQLFKRQGRQLSLTAHGEQILPIVQDFLINIKNTVESIQVTPADNKVVRVQLSQSFALKWLVPILGEFSNENSDIDVWISTSNESLPQSDDVDMAISYIEQEIDGYVCIPLLQEYSFPVCTSSFYNKNKKKLKNPADILKLPLLRRIDNDKSPRWSHWFAQAGVNVFSLPKGIHYPDSGMAVQAAIDNQGIALGTSAHVADDIKQKRLIKLFDIHVTSPRQYYFICEEKKLNNPSVMEFLAWIKDKAEESQEMFDLQSEQSVIKVSGQSAKKNHHKK